MKILVTGGAGMIGSHSAEYFIHQGQEVLVYDNLMRSSIFGSNKQSVEHNWNYLKALSSSSLQLVRGDIRDVDMLERVFSRYCPDVVIHTAGQPGVRMSVEDPTEDYSINSTGTLNVLEALRKINEYGVFIYCSTNKVYGSNVASKKIVEEKKRYRFKDGQGIGETESVDQTGHTPYGVSKLAGDLYTQDYGHTYGIRTGVFRMSCIYGTRQFGFEDQGWIAWFCRSFLTGDPITLYGNGKQVRDVLWVSDLIQSFDNFIRSDELHNVFNIGGGTDNTLSLLELINVLEHRTNRSVEIRISDWRNSDQKVYISDIGKIRQALDWKPKISPANGVDMLMTWMENNADVFLGTQSN